jgi:hypothetical protein
MATRSYWSVIFSATMVATSQAAMGAAWPANDVELTQSGSLERVRAICRRLGAKGSGYIGDPNGLRAFIDSLANERDEKALGLIVAEELPGVEYAARRYVELVGARWGLRLARTLGRYRSWQAMIWALSDGPNVGNVRAYLREKCRVSGAWVRAFCYEVAWCHGWDDLVDNAWQDLKITERLREGWYTDRRLGDLAHDYLVQFEKRRPIPPLMPDVIPPGT